MDSKFLKWSLHVFNLIVLLIGSALVVIGALFLSLFRHDFNFARFSVQNTASSFVIIGGLLILLALFGFVAMRTTNSILYIVHIIGLVVLFIALAILGIWGLVVTFNGDLSTRTRQEINETIYNYNDTNRDIVDSQEVNWLQQKFKCCGLDSYKDWESRNIQYQEIDDKQKQKLRERNQTTFDVPDTCCVNVTDACGKQFPEVNNLNQRGCYEPFFDFLSNDMKILCGIACGLAFLTLLAIAVLVFVAFSVRGDYNELSVH